MSAFYQPAILAVGGAHIDRRGTVSGDYVDGSSNPGTMREEVGGGAFNALRNACRLGARGSMLSLRGGDLAGQLVANAISQAGIADLSATFLDRTTPSYTAILRSDGELVCGFADMNLYELAFDKQLRRQAFRDAVSLADCILTDANLPQNALERLASNAGGKEIFAIAISPAKVIRLRSVLPALSVLFLNLREAYALTAMDADAPMSDMLAALSISGLRRAVITAGSKPTMILDHGRCVALEPPQLHDIRDVTGAGDSLAGVAMLRLMQGLDFPQAVRHGIAAASLTVQSGNVLAEFEPCEFERRLSEIPEPIGA